MTGSIHRVAYRWLVSATQPLPEQFPDTEIGLMTKTDFLRFRNPGDKQHGSDSYDFDLFSLNRDFSIQPVGMYTTDKVRLIVHKAGNRGFIVKKEDLHFPVDKTVAVIHNGVAYYSSALYERDVPTYYYSSQDRESQPIPVTRKKPVKYIQEYVPLVSNVARMNVERYPHLHQRIKSGAEYLEIRFEAVPQRDAGLTIAIINESGQQVAQASNEWGATLLSVAREYRGRGLGKVIGQVWYEWNPSFRSGGFTPAGESNALSLWEDRVRHFLANGWYSELVRQGRLTQERVAEILGGLRARLKPKPSTEPEAKVKPKRVLALIEEGAYFYLYDEAFLTDPVEEYIYGHGFFRESGNKVFLFRLDYERKYHKLATYIALQMARNEGWDLYDGPGYSDLLELDGIDHVEQTGDLIRLTEDVIDVRALGALEERIRRKVDPYQERMYALMEMADSKDWG